MKRISFRLGMLFIGAVCTAGTVQALRTEEQQSQRGEVTCAIDFSVRGAKVKALNGVNLGPRMTGTDVPQRIRDCKRLNVVSVRLHDVPLINKGMKLVDVQQIFPIYNPHADPKDADAYFFDQTDDYLKAILDNSKADIVYRLGTSIEFTWPRQHFAKEPKDHAFYAEVCAGIIRHYTKGWAKGFSWPVKYWEIWNEPQNPPMWDSTNFNTYVNFYVDVAKRLRSEFPSIKIGGPALIQGFNHFKAEPFIRACREKGAPLDFYSWHGYGSDPLFSASDSVFLRKLLDANGFAKAELHFNEWHYMCPIFWTATGLTQPEVRRRWLDARDGLNWIDSAAYITRCLTRWQDLPIDVANYYMMDGEFGLYDLYGAKRPVYYALMLFGDFMQSHPVRAKAQGADAISILGGVGEDGKAELLVTCFKPSPYDTMRFALAGVPSAGKVTITQLGDNATGPSTFTRAYSGGVLTLPPVPSSTLFLIRF